MIYVKSFYWLYPTGISSGGASGASSVNGGMGIKTLSTNPQNQDCDFATYKDKKSGFFFRAFLFFTGKKSFFTTQGVKNETKTNYSI